MKLDEAHSVQNAAPAAAPRAPEKRPESSKPQLGTGKTQNRRTRGLAPASRGKTSAKRSKGRAGVNGHDRASSPSAALHAPAEKGSAASVDASGTSAASATASAAAGTDRDACAEAAQTPKGKKPKSREGGTKPRNSGEPIEIPPGSAPLPADGSGFVDAMHGHLDLYRACARLVKSRDEKIAQRAVERLLEMKYGKGPSVMEEAPQVIFDLPRPEREQQ